MPNGIKLVKVSPEEKNFQHQQQLESELIQLRREYAVLDRNKDRNSLSSYNKLSRSSKVVEIFKQEYENLLKNLSIATSPGKARVDTIQFKHLSSVLEDYSFYNNEVKTLKTQILEVDGQIKKVAKDVQALRKTCSVKNQKRDDFEHKASFVIETLENRLEVQMKRFNMIMARNAELRQQIDFLMSDRHNFASAMTKLIDKLCVGKQIMLDLIEQATLAYDQREDWCSRLKFLRIKGHKDLISNLDEMRQYEHKLIQGKKLDVFFTIKGQKRVMRDLMEKERIKRLEMEKTLKEKLETFNQMMSDIYEFTKQNETEIIATRYYQQEAANFSQFQFIISLIKEMESANDSLGEMYQKTDEQRHIHELRSQQQKDVLDQLEVNLEIVSNDRKESQNDLNKIEANLKELMDGIYSLFTLCHCDKDPLLKLLGDNSKCKDYNVLLYLQILESTLYEYLLRAGYKQKILGEKKPSGKAILASEGPSRIYSIDKIVKDEPCPLCFEHELVSDVIDEVQIPLTQKEVRRKVKKHTQTHSPFVHRLSKCVLPQSRRLMQRRYE